MIEFFSSLLADLNTLCTVQHLYILYSLVFCYVILIIIDNRGLNARWCLTPLLLSLPTAAYLEQRGLTPAGLPHITVGALSPKVFRRSRLRSAALSSCCCCVRGGG